MNKDLIQKAIENPEFLEQLSAGELEHITSEFPYFTSAHLLLLKKYQAVNDYRFTHQLHTAATYVANRKVLYEYVKQKEKGKHESRTQMPEEITLANTPIHFPEHTPLQIEPEQPEVTRQPVPEFLPIPQPVFRANDMDDLQREIIVEAVSSSIEKEVADDVAEQKEPLAVIEPEAGFKENESETHAGDDYSLWLHRRASQIHYLEKVESSRPASERPEAASDWLRTTQAEAEQATNQTSETIAVEKPSLKLHQQQLIDRFIRMEPKITPGKADEYLTGNIARTSIEEDISIVSETIADLYVKQGKMDRARKAYRKLMELYPEKSIYFAARLKNLDKNKK
ncbi:MAG: tetratricopeptide repeat protein [Flavobacteriales bacterium]|nr:tetratricopeptide repeat protein [Flavobacteriales bacterium]